MSDAEPNKKNRGGGGNGDKPKVRVTGYERSGGSKVNQHERGRPKRERQDAEPMTKHERQDEEDADPHQQQQQQGRQDGEEDPEQQQDKHEEGDDLEIALPDGGGDGGGDNGDEEDSNEAPVQPMAKRPAMNVHEYLEMVLRDQASGAVQRLVEEDPSKAGVVARDAAANAPPAVPGRMHFVNDVKAAARKLERTGDDDIKGIISNAWNKKYDDDGEWGKRSLVPHLQTAGLFDLAMRVMSGQYTF